MKHAKTCKLCHINQKGQTTTWKETCIQFKKYAECRLWANIKFIEIFVTQEYFFTGKKPVVETISMATTDSCHVRYFELYLINIFMKSTKAERCADIMFRLTFCLSVTIADLNL